MKKADNFNASKWLVENKITTQSRLNEENQPYKVISKKTEKSEFDNKTKDDIYNLELKNETYTTSDGLTFQLKTMGNVMIPKDEKLDFDNKSHYFFYIKTLVYDKNGKELGDIPGEKSYERYNLSPSLNKAKKWLDKKGAQLMSGKGFQYKST